MKNYVNFKHTMDIYTNTLNVFLHNSGSENSKLADGEQ